MNMTDTFTVLRILTDETVTDIPNAVGAFSWEWVFSKGTEEINGVGTTILPPESMLSADSATTEDYKNLAVNIDFISETNLQQFFEMQEDHLNRLNRINSLTEYFVDSAYTYQDEIV